MSRVDVSTRRTLVAIGTVLATLLFSVDMTIVNVALPHMQGSLQATQDQIAWVVTSYIVASAVATPLAGWLAARFGLRAVLSASVVGFTVSSALCGIAGDLGEVVSFRFLQGIFGAALIPLSQVTLLQEYPPDKHGRVMALWSLGVLVGPVIGPALGGWLTESASWRWAFFINVPIGIISFLSLRAGLDKAHEDTRRRPLDWTGFLLLSLVLALSQLALDRGHSLDWFASSEIVAEVFFATILFFMFLVHTATAKQPFIDPALFRHRNFVLALMLMFTVGVAMVSPTMLVPAFLQSLQGYSPADAGLVTSSRGVGSIMAVLITGRLVGKVSPRILIGGGVLMATLSAGPDGRHVGRFLAQLYLAGGVRWWYWPAPRVRDSVRRCVRDDAARPARRGRFDPDFVAYDRLRYRRFGRGFDAGTLDGFESQLPGGGIHRVFDGPMAGAGIRTRRRRADVGAADGTQPPGRGHWLLE